MGLTAFASRWLASHGLPRLPFSSPGPRLVLVGLDGADWNIIDPLLARGEMPNLSRLIERGSRSRLLSFQPMLSPVLWTTIATGVRPDKHGIVDFVAVAADTGRMVPVTSNLRRAPAFWNLCSDAGISVGVTAWWATYPAERVRGYLVSDRIAYQLFGIKPDERPEGKTHPPEIYGEVHSLVVDPASIGEERLARYLGPAAPQPGGRSAIDEQEIERQLRALIASEDTYRRIAARLAARFRPEVEVLYLENTDTIAHLTMKFRPPLMPGADPLLAQRFGRALDETYREADRALGEVLARGGESADILICSDHGFRSGTDRPVSTESRIEKGKAADWHRKYGILVMAGPHLRRGVEIREPSLLDIAPTMLALLGEPVPASFQGRVLTEAISEEFLREHPIRTAPAMEPSAEPERAASGPLASGSPPAPHPAGGASSEEDAVVEKLISLGYLSQDSLNARNNRGILHMNKGEFAAAIADFESALADNPNQAGVLVNLARCRWLSGDPRKAKEILARSLKLAPNSAEAENLSGNVAMATGEPAEAERHFRRALEIEPEHTDTHNSLGILYETQSKWQEALAEYRRVVDVDPDYGEGYNNIGNVLKKLGKVAEAESWYRRAMEADPSFAGSYNNLALLLQDRGDMAGAEKLYQRSVELNPKEPKTHNNLGSLYFLRGEQERALAEFRMAATLDPKYAEARNSLGVVYGKLGQEKDEMEAYREAIRLNPSYADAHYNLGLLLLRRGEAAEGRRELELALRSEPRHLPALVTLSNVARGEGDARRAVALARRAVEAGPSSAGAHLVLGEALAASGDRAGARRELSSALQIDGSLQEARKVLAALGGAG